MVIPRLAEFVGSPILTAKGKIPLSPMFELAAIQHTAGKMEDQKPLGEVAGHPKLHQSLLRTFRELDRLSPPELKQLAELDRLRNQMTSWYFAAREITKKYYTREELSREAAQGLTQPESASVLSDLGHIIFYLISDLSPAETGIALQLYKSGKATVILGVTGNAEVDEQIIQLLHKFEPEYKASLENKGVQHLIERAVIAHNYREEVKWIVRHILYKAENGIPFNRTAILYHNAYPYAGYILQQLRTAGIPGAGPSVTPIKNTPPGKMVVCFLEVIQSDFTRDALMRWAAESPIKAAPANLPVRAELARWEVISCNAGIIRGREQWNERLQTYKTSLTAKIENPDVTEEKSPSELNGLKEELNSLDLLAQFAAQLTSISIPQEGSPYSVFAAWLLELIDDYAYNPAGWPDEGQQILERIQELINDIGSLDNLFTSGTTLAGFTDLVGNALSTPAGRAGITGEGVFVGPTAAANGMDFETIYITGMSEAAFPSRHHIDPLLPDSVRTTISGGNRLALSNERKIEQRRHYLTALAAGKTCIISYSQTDVSAERGQYASPWFLEELERLNGSPLSAHEMENPENRPWLSVIYSSEHALNYAEGLSPLDIQDYDMASLARWRERRRSSRPHFLFAETTPAGRAVKMEQARRSVEFSIWDGNLTALAGKSRRLGLPGSNHFSPTRLEKWAGCPMSYFLGHVLEIPVYEKPEEIVTIEPMEKGSLVHGVLERFIRTLKDTKQLPDYGEPWSEQQASLLINIAHEEFSRVEESGITGRHLMWAMTREEIERDLITFLDEDNTLRAAHGLKPVRVEQSFGMDTGKGLPAVTLRVNEREINLHGFIDRIDANQKGDKYYVIDYKTGGSSYYYGMKKDPLECGRRLQLPVYGMAVRQSLNTRVEITACYWFVSTKGNFDRHELELSSTEERFKKTVELIVTGIESGIFPAYPGETGKDNCKSCNFKRICTADRDSLWERKSGAGELTLYRRLLDRQPSEEADNDG
jgi:ATP-dependent helicase/DNAse subunit B